MKRIALIEFTPNHYDFIIAASYYYEDLAKVELFIHKDAYQPLIFEYKANYKTLHIPKINTYANYNELLKESFESFNEVVFLSITFTWKIIYILYIIKKINTPYSIVVHNINSWLQFGKLNLKNILRYFVKKYIINNPKHLIVLNKNLKKTLSEKVSKQILVIPFKMPVTTVSKIQNEKPVIVIPGTVDQTKRDYKNILKLFNKINFNYSLVLLGKIKDPAILGLLKENRNIIWFEKYISQDIFDQYMKSCNLLLAPTIKEYTWGSSSTEVYGITKASGAEFDCLKYKKQLLINDFYRIDDYLKEHKMVIQFSGINGLEKELNHFFENQNQIEDTNKIVESFNNKLKQNFLKEWN
jgi:hypothetical protein